MVACVITEIHKETPGLMVGMATRAIEDDDDSLLTTSAYDIYDDDRDADTPIMVVPRWWWWWWWWWWGVGFKVACHTSPPSPPMIPACKCRAGCLRQLLTVLPVVLSHANQLVNAWEKIGSFPKLWESDPI